jgi:hypothetical protein
MGWAQSNVCLFPKYWPPTPNTARQVCKQEPLVLGNNTLAGWRVGGGLIFWRIKDTALYLSVWRIQDVYLGSRILIFTHTGSRIPNSKTVTKERGAKKIFYTFFPGSGSACCCTVLCVLRFKLFSSTMLTMPLNAHTDITIPNAKCPKCKVDTENKLIKLLVICLVSVLILTINSAKKTDSLHCS